MKRIINISEKYKLAQNLKRDVLLKELSEEDLQVLVLAYVYAKNIHMYGIDVTEKLVTATQNACALEKAYYKGYYDGLEQQEENNFLNFEKEESVQDEERSHRKKQGSGMSDLISRQAAIDAIGNVPYHDDGMVWEALSHAQRDVALLPSVVPESKIGRWICAKVGKIFPSNDFKCSECGNILDFNGVNCGRGDANYCPNCGARMVKSQEGEDKA